MTSDNLIVVAEGKSDVLILRSILYKELRNGMRFFAAQGRESLVTLGRNLLVHEGGPVLLVMEVATAELPIRDEKVAEMMRALSTLGVPGMFQVCAFTPAIDVVFFEAPDAIERALGISVTGATLADGLTHPKDTLGHLLAQAKVPNTDVLVRKLDETALEALSRGKQAAAFRDRVRVFTNSEKFAGA